MSLFWRGGIPCPHSRRRRAPRIGRVILALLSSLSATRQALLLPSPLLSNEFNTISRSGSLSQGHLPTPLLLRWRQVSTRGRSGPHFRLVSAGPGFGAGYSS